MPLRIAHIINLAFNGVPQELARAEPLVLQSMRRAAEHCRPDIIVDQLSAQFPDDRPHVPSFMSPTRDLDRSVLDTGSFRTLRRLPLLRDILDRLDEAAEAPWCIYTNADIILRSHFYRDVAATIADGYDAFVINREDVDDVSVQRTLNDVLTLRGMLHPGFDCFVFSRELLKRIVVGNVCIGAPHVDLPFICSLIAYARRFRIFRDARLTVQLGNRERWKDARVSDYARRNDREAARALQELEQSRGLTGKMGWIYSLLLRRPLLWNKLCVREWQKRTAQYSGFVAENS